MKVFIFRWDVEDPLYELNWERTAIVVASNPAQARKRLEKTLRNEHGLLVKYQGVIKNILQRAKMDQGKLTNNCLIVCRET